MSIVRAFYDDLAQEYDAMFADWEAGVRWQAGVIEPLLGAEPDPVLDLAAGIGTQAIGLALRGHRVVARDLSAPMVERGRSAASRLGVAVEFAVADMTQAQPADSGRFGAVIAFDNALPHLATDEQLVAALSAARAALRPGGRFVASIRDYDELVKTRPALDPARLLGTAPARRLVLQVWDWAPDGRSYEFTHLMLHEGAPDWRTHTRRSRYRALLRSELDAAARAAGLVELQWLMPEASGYYQPIFCARRPA